MRNGSVARLIWGTMVYKLKGRRNVNISVLVLQDCKLIYYSIVTPVQANKQQI
jgi:hypothetical protein